jgi:hypothetical protein
MRPAQWLITGLVGAVAACGGEVTDDAARGSAAGDAGQVAVHGGRGPIGGRSATGGAGGAPCGIVLEDVVQSIPPAFEFVVDIGESMTEKAYPGTTDPTSKWDTLSGSLLGLLQSAGLAWVVGIEYFNLIVPSSPPATPVCFQGRPAVPIALMTDAQKAAMTASIDSITAGGAPWQLGGYAPTLAAWRHALSQVAQAVRPETYHAIVLMTDGVPTVRNDGCTIEQPISRGEYDAFVDIVRSEGAAANVKTFVVGVPGSQDAQGADYDPRFYLSNLAIAGGTAPLGCTSSPGTLESDGTYQNGIYCHLDLAEAPNAIARLFESFGSDGAPPSCSPTFPPLPSDGRVYDYSSMEVSYTPAGATARTRLTQFPDGCQTASGYVWGFETDPARVTISLCQDACSAWLADGAPVIEIALGCA